MSGLSQSETSPLPQGDDPATTRIERAQAREAAGWDPALVSALNILEYGCDEGHYDDEVAAVAKLAEALGDHQRLVKAARKVVAAVTRGDLYAEHPAVLNLEAVLDGEI